MTELDLTCPNCGRANELTQPIVEGDAPDPGAISICWKCLGVGIFTETGLRLPSAEEEQELLNHPQIIEIRAAAARSQAPEQAIAALRRMYHDETMEEELRRWIQHFDVI